MKIKELFKLIACFYATFWVYIINVALINRNLYTNGWLDIPVHFLGGASIAYGFILVLRKVKEKVVIKDRFFEILIITSLVGLIAVIWEFYEKVSGMQLGLDDTLLDLFMGIMGGLAVTCFVKIKNDNKN